VRTTAFEAAWAKNAKAIEELKKIIAGPSVEISGAYCDGSRGFSTISKGPFVDWPQVSDWPKAT
jgi:hypothetical protein